MQPQSRSQVSAVSDITFEAGATSISISKPHTIKVNVSGSKFEFSASLLSSLSPQNLPDPLLRLGQVAAKERFYDRNPLVLSAVLDYLRSGELHAPTGVCEMVLATELQHWGLSRLHLQGCCLSRLSAAQSSLKQWDEMSQLHEKAKTSIDTQEDKRWRRIQQQVWKCLDQPDANFFTALVAAISFLLVMASICSLYTQSLPQFRVVHDANGTLTDKQPVVAHGLRVFDLIVAAIFTIELVVRLICCPCKKSYFKDVLNLIDILSLLPFYFEGIVILTKNARDASVMLDSTAPLYVLRVLRVLRIYHLIKWYTPLKVLRYTVWRSRGELLMLLLLLTSLSLTFAGLIFAIELVSLEATGKTDFNSMFHGLWWAVVTMTTVGYGDLTPVSAGGRVVGCLGAVSGLLLFACASAPIAANFSTYYQLFVNTGCIHQEQAQHRKSQTTSLFRKNLFGTKPAKGGKTSLSSETEPKSIYCGEQH